MGYRRLNEQEWASIESCFPQQHMGRPRRWNDRDCLDALFYILYSGSRWNDLPKEFPPCTSVYDRFSLWVKQGVIQKVFRKLRKRLPLGKMFYLDSTVKTAKKGQMRRTRGENEGQQNKPRNRRSGLAV